MKAHSRIISIKRNKKQKEKCNSNNNMSNSRQLGKNAYKNNQNILSLIK